MADALGADAIIELGLGNKSVKMLRDNDILTPVFPFTGDSLEAMHIVRALRVLSTIRGSKEITQACTGVNSGWKSLGRVQNFQFYYRPK